MENFGRKNLQKWDIVWGEIEVKVSNKINNHLEEKIRDKVFFNILAQTESQLYFQTLNNLKK